MKKKTIGIEKVETGIAGVDYITMGGLPKGRTTLLVGTSGSSKTVFAVQYLAEGILRGENGVFVTFEETPSDIRKNMINFGWDIEQWEKEGKWTFVDSSPRAGESTMEAGSYNLSALMVRIKGAINKVSASRLSLDSLGAIFSQFSDSSIVRSELFNISATLKEIGITSIMTAERIKEYGEITRFGVEEFVSDNVIILRNILDLEKRRRTIEVLKLRGTNHLKGEFPFTVMPDKGMVVIPLTKTRLEQQSSMKRSSFGNSVLNDMCGGGVFTDSIILVSGATGTGKTMITAEFIAGKGCEEERSLLFAFEESKEQLFRNATGWGKDFKSMEKEGRLKVVAVYPETATLEDHLIKMIDYINEFKPTRVIVDSISALKRIASNRGYGEFVIGLAAFLKDKQITGLLTSTDTGLIGSETSYMDEHISSMTDSIIMLYYVEKLGEMRRGLIVLKMRGSNHDKQIREFTIDESGMHIEEPFKNITGILSGNPKHIK